MTPEYQRDAIDVVAALGSDSSRGLSNLEARARLEQYGPNRLAAERPVPAWQKFLRQFRDVLVVLLLMATAISAVLWVYERDSPLPYEALAISAVVLLNAIMGYLQEQRAESAIAALQKMAAAQAHVIRDGTVTSIPASDVVPGDIIVVEEGGRRARGGPNGLENGGSRPHRRELARLERRRCYHRRRWPRRPRQHDLQRHFRDVRSRSGGTGS